MNPLHTIVVACGSLGAGDLLARLLPDKAEPRVMTIADTDAIARARYKRERRAAKRMGAKP
jgi:hypothetical protein